MVKIGSIGSQVNTLLTQIVGKMQSMNVCASLITSANSGGISVMNEGQALLLIMTMMVIGTIVLNFIVFTALFS